MGTTQSEFLVLPCDPSGASGHAKHCVSSWSLGYSGDKNEKVPLLKRANVRKDEWSERDEGKDR